jgi:hypothetical protein
MENLGKVDYFTNSSNLLKFQAMYTDETLSIQGETLYKCTAVRSNVNFQISDFKTSEKKTPVWGRSGLPDCTYISQFWHILERPGMEKFNFILWPFGTFYGHLVHFMAILVHFMAILVHFMAIWYFFCPFLQIFPILVCCTKKKSGCPG